MNQSSILTVIKSSKDIKRQNSLRENVLIDIVFSHTFGIFHFFVPTKSFSKRSSHVSHSFLSYSTHTVKVSYSLVGRTDLVFFFPHSFLFMFMFSFTVTYFFLLFLHSTPYLSTAFIIFYLDFPSNTGLTPPEFMMRILELETPFSFLSW